MRSFEDDYSVQLPDLLVVFDVDISAVLVVFFVLFLVAIGIHSPLRILFPFLGWSIFWFLMSSGSVDSEDSSVRSDDGGGDSMIFFLFFTFTNREER